ncbi:MAG: hypothetical protein HC840_00305 [Leptolyngbyaceae cyanobacterium RM2_2_4]|nr:hypothetical protein [Leptolyngbyaceae cyanobacterium RM2_2_4]
MAIEQKWPAVAPQAFTADGGAQGQITVADVRGFKVKQFVVIKATGQPDIRVQVKRVVKKTGKIIVGPPQDQQTQGKAGLQTRTDLTAYTLLAGAFLYAEEQDKVRVKKDDQDAATYEQEPTVARRVVAVDQFGDFYDDDNRVPVKFDGGITVGNVTIQDDDGDELEVNPDGSINVNIINSTGSNVVKNTYAEASAVPSGVETTIVTYMVPLILTSALLQRVSASGENVGRFQVFVNGVVVDTRRTYYGGDFNTYFEFATSSADGYSLAPGDIVLVKILHDRAFSGSFQARIQALEIA